MNLQNIVSLTPGQVSCQLGAETAILNLKSGVYFGLNPVGAFIWKAITDTTPVRKIRDAVLAEYDVTPECCEHDLIDLLTNLSAEGLVEVQ
jgi:hypothetical protein